MSNLLFSLSEIKTLVIKTFIPIFINCFSPRSIQLFKLDFKSFLSLTDSVLDDWNDSQRIRIKWLKNLSFAFINMQNPTSLKLSDSLFYNSGSGFLFVVFKFRQYSFKSIVNGLICVNGLIVLISKIFYLKKLFLIGRFVFVQKVFWASRNTD